jgi:transcriptional regulator with XRE-family HTH domain
VRQKRLDAGLLQKEVALWIGVSISTIIGWERNRVEPPVRYLPAIIDFLGYVPFPLRVSLPERLKGYRQLLGWSRQQMAGELGIDESTLRAWETGTRAPRKARYMQCVEQILEALPLALGHSDRTDHRGPGSQSYLTTTTNCTREAPPASMR